MKHRQLSYLGVVGGLLDDLRGHPERRSHEGFPLYLRVRQLTRHPEVRQLHLAVLRQQDVGSYRELTASLSQMNQDLLHVVVSFCHVFKAPLCGIFK